MSIETRFDIPLVAAMALREKQIQQNYRPIIAVHKWFARRPGTLFRGLVLSEFGDRPLSETFFTANDFPGKVVADPFMGGGTPLLEANRVGCDVHGFDVNPMAAWIVREEIEHIDIGEYAEAANSLIQSLNEKIGDGYRTDCPLYGDRDVPVKYFLWVKVLDCEECQRQFDLFPGYLIADDTRHPKNVIVCSKCGDLNEVASLRQLGHCKSCRSALILSGPAKRNHCVCPFCGHTNSYPHRESGPPNHRMFAIEYFNPKRKHSHAGRFFKKPDVRDLRRAEKASIRSRNLDPQFVPHQPILPGDETDRLHRWGYRHYRELFSARQLLGLELSCRLISRQSSERIKHALATNLSDLLRYQNLLCRYDTMALKSLDIFSVHGFPVGLVACESNLIGIINGAGVNVGSGGWRNIVEKYTKAKQYCEAPFEVIQKRGKKTIVQIQGEWIGERLNGRRPRRVSLSCVSATAAKLRPESLDAVFTDPPYFGNVQYGELMDFCYVWLRQLVGKLQEGFDRFSTRSPQELTGNQTESRGLEEFAEGLANVYRKMAVALKPGAPLAFTFHHNQIDAYATVGVAILDAGLVCSATLPCPAEMGGSIHIHGTGSSIVDTVFVCRSKVPKVLKPFRSANELAGIVREEIDYLRTAGLKASHGDIRCIVYGHLTRIAVWTLRKSWDSTLPIRERLKRFRDELFTIPDVQSVIVELSRSRESPDNASTHAPGMFEDIPNAISL